MSFTCKETVIIFTSDVKNLKKEDIQLLTKRFKFAVCLDGAFDIFYKNKIWPKYVVGDLDSTKFREILLKNRELLFYKESQEITDLGFAVQKLEAMDEKQFVIFSTKSGRVDHFFKNLNFLKKTTSIKAIFGQDFDIIKIQDKFSFEIEEKSQLSFFATNGKSKVKTSGLKWDFDFLDEDFSSTSNEAAYKKIDIKILDGNGILLFADRCETEKYNIKKSIVYGV